MFGKKKINGSVAQHMGLWKQRHILYIESSSIVCDVFYNNICEIDHETA